MQSSKQHQLKLVRIILRNTLGSILIILGILGLFLPVLQGWLMIFVGVSLLKFKRKDEFIRKFKHLRPIRPLAHIYDVWKKKALKRARRTLQ